MEKRTPHTPLHTVQALVMEGRVRVTKAALIGARQSGCDHDDIIENVLALSMKEFYKSMTTHADYTIWQDVYHRVTPFGEVYLKLTVLDDVLIISFKEL